MEEIILRTKREFLETLRNLVKDNIPKKQISVVTPYHVHETEEILSVPTSKLKYFTFGGCLAGLLGGFAFTIYTVLDWPLITGGKPIVSIPPFVIIAFALTILLGATVSFVGFLLLADLPDIREIVSPREYGNNFVILIDRKD